LHWRHPGQNASFIAFGAVVIQATREALVGRRVA